MSVFNEYGIICGAFILPTQEDDVNLPHVKIPGKMGGKVNPKKVGRTIHPIWQYLLNMVLLVTHLF